MKIENITEQEVNDIIEKDNIDFSSFEIQPILNPKIFNKTQHMYDKVRQRLLMISDDFFETLNIEWVDIDDIILTGSLANYNWSKYSDVDLHILIDFKNVNENEEFVREYFTSKKNLWNEEHNITIKSYDVELYVQDSHEPHVSSGVYSVLWDGWVIKPEYKNIKIDLKNVVIKVNSVISTIKHIYTMYKSKKYNKTIRNIKIIKEKLKKMRKSGLDREGEYSFENITFKVLRRSGYLEKLYDLETLSYDKSLTLDETFKIKKNK